MVKGKQKKLLVHLSIDSSRDTLVSTCRELATPVSGTKPQLFARIEKHMARLARVAASEKVAPRGSEAEAAERQVAGETPLSVTQEAPDGNLHQ